MHRLRLVFMGSPEFALPVLDALAGAGHEVACVYTGPPRPAGRGMKERRSAVHVSAAEKGLDVRTPESLKGGEEQAAFAALAADAAVVVAYGLILPKAVIEAPRLGCLNVHASLLPRWRGAAPIQRAILAGDGETGVTIMKIDEGLDTGPVVLAEKVPITPETTAAALGDELAGLGARLMLDALEGLAAGTLTPAPQPSEGATYAPKLGRGEGRLDWRRPAAELERQMRALTPWPGVWFELGGERVKVLAAEATEDPPAPPAAAGGISWPVPPGSRGAPVIENRGDTPRVSPGTVVDDALGVACGSGVFRPARLQRPGRMPQDRAAFQRGFPMPPGTRLT